MSNRRRQQKQKQQQKNETDKQESQQLHMMRFVDLHHKHQQSQLAVEELEKKKSRFCLAKVIRI